MLPDGTGRKEIIMAIINSEAKYEIHLCKFCIQDLDNYYPYIIPRSKLYIVEVPDGECDNHNLDDYNERLKARNPEFCDGLDQ